MEFNIKRPRRNRKSTSIRALVKENTVQVNQLVQPVFLVDGSLQKHEITSMPGVFRYSLDLALEHIGHCMTLGLTTFILFPAVEDRLKDRFASYSYHPDCFYLKAISEIKKQFPECTIITDVAMDPYSSDGHDGLYDNGQILNDETLAILDKMALAQARAGADILGPSDMMDGRVGHIRRALDANNYSHVSIMSYTAKYASCFYGPFRDALESAPKFGDKLSYQMHPANSREALLEAELDEAEGADFLMVKPALSYLDIIAKLRKHSKLPIAAYHVSGEYAMIKAAAEKGWIDEQRAVDEVLTSIKRAGADIIITYFALNFAERQLNKL
ncbi:MAG: porphobilinogen synthase [Bacteroidia bacterium]|jgi:porphobilinogen synthase